MLRRSPALPMFTADVSADTSAASRFGSVWLLGWAVVGDDDVAEAQGMPGYTSPVCR